MPTFKERLQQEQLEGGLEFKYLANASGQCFWSMLVGTEKLALHYLQNVYCIVPRLTGLGGDL